ncbi:hypothetical protein D3C87_2149340 [compost metagenome]
MEAGGLRLHKGNGVMVGTVHGVHEGDNVFRAIRQANAQGSFVKRDCVRQVRGEQHDV